MVFKKSEIVRSVFFPTILPQPERRVAREIKMAYKLNLYANGVFERMLGHTSSPDEVLSMATSFEKEHGLRLDKVEMPKPLEKMGSEYPITIELHDFEIGHPIRWWHFVKDFEFVRDFGAG